MPAAASRRRRLELSMVPRGYGAMRWRTSGIP
jgi:hypothetical protein